MARLLNNTHSCVIVVVTPGELAGHLVLLEIRLSADQCNTSVCWRGEEKGKTNVNQTRKSNSPPEDTMLVKAAAGCKVSD